MKEEYIKTDWDLKDESCGDVWKEILRHPVLSEDEKVELALMAQNGNMQARERLINCNLKLVYAIAKTYENKCVNMDIYDLFQEGTIGLVNSITKFDPSLSSFGSYAAMWIRQAIGRAIANKEQIVRIPVNVREQLQKYHFVISDFKKQFEDVPSDDDMCDILGASKERLDVIKEISATQFLSLNEKINNNKTNNPDDQDELEFFVGGEDENFDKFINAEANGDLFVLLKTILTPLQYYIIYNRYLQKCPWTLERIGEQFSVTREAVRHKEKKALQQIMSFFDINSYTWQTDLISTINKNNIKVAPVTPEQIELYIYIMDKLTQKEQIVLYYEFFGERKMDFYIECLNLTVEEYLDISQKLKTKIATIDISEFNAFKRELIKASKFTIYDEINNIRNTIGVLSESR